MAHQKKILHGNEAEKKDFSIFFLILRANVGNKAPEKQKIRKTSFTDNPSQNIPDFFEFFVICVETTSDALFDILKKSFVVIYHCDLSISLEPWALGRMGEKTRISLHAHFRGISIAFEGNFLKNPFLAFLRGKTGKNV